MNFYSSSEYLITSQLDFPIFGLINIAVCSICYYLASSKTGSSDEGETSIDYPFSSSKYWKLDKSAFISEVYLTCKVAMQWCCVFSTYLDIFLISSRIFKYSLFKADTDCDDKDALQKDFGDTY